MEGPRNIAGQVKHWALMNRVGSNMHTNVFWYHFPRPYLQTVVFRGTLTTQSRGLSPKPLWDCNCKLLVVSFWVQWRVLYSSQPTPQGWRRFFRNTHFFFCILSQSTLFPRVVIMILAYLGIIWPSQSSASARFSPFHRKLMLTGSVDGGAWNDMPLQWRHSKSFSEMRKNIPHPSRRHPSQRKLEVTMDEVHTILSLPYGLTKIPCLLTLCDLAPRKAPGSVKLFDVLQQRAIQTFFPPSKSGPSPRICKHSIE